MDLDTICQQILHYKVENKTEDFEITTFFDQIGEEIHKLDISDSSQKEKLIKVLFKFIKNQNPEMEENFSFIHLIENIDTPNYKIYETELVKFAKENGTITSILLLNRHINSLDKIAQAECLNILKSIAENDNFTNLVRQEALNYYNYQKEI
ncbi:hypothetical protein [uncultured Kordia sp.]|uniref:hypothetical protein n=1 Tax=uncultured Kordia sp. TaxID=507699 RepID=UPI00260517C5|nr:hypothetical protein [uncultured Kordia sp.]